MFDLPIKELLEPKKFLTAAPDQTVRIAAQQMASKNAGAVLVVEDDRLVGIFTERDAVFRVVAMGLDPSTTPLATVMTSNPRSLDAEKTYGHALLVMQEQGFRHVPVVENERLIGIVSARNAMDPTLEEFVSEQRRREHYR